MASYKHFNEPAMDNEDSHNSARPCAYGTAAMENHSALVHYQNPSTQAHGSSAGTDKMDDAVQPNAGDVEVTEDMVRDVFQMFKGWKIKDVLYEINNSHETRVLAASPILRTVQLLPGASETWRKNKLLSYLIQSRGKVNEYPCGKCKGTHWPWVEAECVSGEVGSTQCAGGACSVHIWDQKKSKCEHHVVSHEQPEVVEDTKQDVGQQEDAEQQQRPKRKRNSSSTVPVNPKKAKTAPEHEVQQPRMNPSDAATSTTGSSTSNASEYDVGGEIYVRVGFLLVPKVIVKDVKLLGTVVDQLVTFYRNERDGERVYLRAYELVQGAFRRIADAYGFRAKAPEQVSSLRAQVTAMMEKQEALALETNAAGSQN